MPFKLNRKKQTLEATHVQCPSCENISAVEKWNNIVKHTYGDSAPDVRQAAINRKNSFPFQCPSCYKGYSAHVLIFHQSEARRQKLSSSSKPSELS
ncbi:hypothetical protein [Alkalicoccus halolimnae]|uniref:C2H2-type domain-containing protein n=1 Tax=Alkalicoccus halolimnae TaxID=1667239 RepID=A0A5C7FLN9_9BACI|nr:hypothetical protein [Alkalicoccus halolimnae]TXF86999.1 hypothetical protein FTX54_03475 [Alkalicoccus halolimnae]